MSTFMIKEKVNQYGTEKLDYRELISFTVGIPYNKLESYKCLIDMYRDIEFMKITKLQKQKLQGLFHFSSLVARDTAPDRITINSPGSIAKLLIPEMQYLSVEHLKIILLNAKNQIIGIETLAIGTVNSSLVDIREVFIAALSKRAVHIILVHNHPSGDPTPSTEDIMITKRLDIGSELVGIRLLDHLIIGSGCYKSIKGLGYL